MLASVFLLSALAGTPTQGEPLAADAAPDVEPAAQTPFEARRLSLEVRLGLATPTGWYGAAVEYSLLPEFALGCGAGNSSLSLEPGCWARARLLIDANKAYTLASGFSTASYNGNGGSVEDLFSPFVGQIHESQAMNFHVAHALWWNTDVGYEYRRRAYVFRAFVGAAVFVNRNDAVSNSPNLTASPLFATMYLGFGFGFAP